MRCPFQTIDMPFVSLDISRQEDCLIATFFQNRRAMRMEGLSCNAFVAKIFYQIHFAISIWATGNLRHNPCSRKVTFL